MKRQTSVLCTLALLVGSLPVLFAQGTQPSQPVDPTAQAPATPAPEPDTKQRPDKPKQGQPDEPSNSQASDSRAARVFMGTIVNDRGTYVLKSADVKFGLDDQREAKKYAGRDVKVTGRLNKASNVIRVENIEESPSM